MKRFISLDELMRRRDFLLALLMLSVGLDFVLGLTLAIKALERRPILVLPSATLETPGDVSDAAARSFCRLYLVTFDTYTPSTLPAATEWLKKRISPRAWSLAGENLDRRISIAREGRMSSISVPQDDGTVDRERGITVSVKARRTLFIADHLSRESNVVYRFEIESIPPTAGNPEGLAVVRQTVEELHETAR